MNNSQNHDSSGPASVKYEILNSSKTALPVIEPKKTRLHLKTIVLIMFTVVVFIVLACTSIYFLNNQFGKTINDSLFDNSDNSTQISDDIFIDSDQPIPETLPKDIPIKIKYAHNLGSVCKGYKIENAAALDKAKDSDNSVIFAHNSSHRNNYYVPIDIDVDVENDGSAKINTISIVACANSDESNTQRVNTCETRGGQQVPLLAPNYNVSYYEARTGKKIGEDAQSLPGDSQCYNVFKYYGTEKQPRTNIIALPELTTTQNITRKFINQL
jgi:hypothetical protein